MLLSSVRAFTTVNNHHFIMKTRSASSKTTTKLASVKKTAAKKKKNPNKAKVAAPAAVNSAKKGDEPWFNIFTKGDEEYTTYMTNEWGFETVSAEMNQSFFPPTNYRTVSALYLTTYCYCYYQTREEIKPSLKRSLWKAPNLVFLG